MSAITVRSSSGYELFLPDLFPIEHGIHRRPSAAHLALMSSFIVVVIQPAVQIDLQPLNVAVDFLPEGHLVELLQDGRVESLTDTVGLG